VITFDEVGAMLDDIAEEIPKDFYRELNGGIILLPRTKRHPASHNTGNLYIMGEYHNDRKGFGGLGRYICIYYGSFIKLYANATSEQQKEELRKILIHEFIHHLESLAGERGLAIQDAVELEKYKQKFNQ
jgi:predicted Zn-dependent protease with MMP-like domain